MTHVKLGFLVAFSVAILVAPALAGDCIKLKGGKWHQPGPAEGAKAPSAADFEKSPYTVTAEDYDELSFAMKLPNGKTQKQTLDTSKVESVSYDSIPPAFAAAASLMSNGEYPAAIEKFNAVAADRGERPWARTMALINIATIHEAEAKWDGANEAWERLASDFPKSRYVPKAYIQVGLNYLNKNDVSSARNSFGKLGRLQGLPAGQKALAEYYLIFIQQKQGEATKDQGVLRQALNEYKALLGKTEADPAMLDVAILSRLGIGTCQVLLGQFDEALAFFQKIADAATDTSVLAGAFNGLGECYFKKNQWRDALLSFLRVEILYDANPEQTARALYSSGRCFEFMGGAGEGVDSYVRAKAQYARCVGRFPGTTWAREARDRSAAIRAR